MTQVSFIGSATLDALQKQKGQPPKQKLAQVVAQKATDRYNEIYNKTVEFLVANITENAVKRDYIFDLKKFIGDKFKTECPESLYIEIESWLNDEGFKVDTQRNRMVAEIDQHRRWLSNYNSVYSTKHQNQPSDMTFFIKW